MDDFTLVMHGCCPGTLPLVSNVLYSIESVYHSRSTLYTGCGYDFLVRCCSTCNDLLRVSAGQDTVLSSGNCQQSPAKFCLVPTSPCRTIH